MTWKVVLIVLFIALTFCLSQSAVFSVDLGSESVKVAVVNLKPGQSPISIAINEISERNSPALVSFHGGHRLLAEEAAGLAARCPPKARPRGETLRFSEEDFGLNVFAFRGEGRLQMRHEFGRGRKRRRLLARGTGGRGVGLRGELEEFHAKIPIKDAVITVPPYLGQAERRGLVVAAQLAEINVLSLINEHSGAAVQYGMDKNFLNESRHVIFYDMGSSSTYTALVYFSSDMINEYGKSVPVNQFEVKDVRWNPELGEYFADEFNAQVGGGIDVRNFPRAMAKLRKPAKRTKEILSANTAAPISVEPLHDDVDFRSTITREKFEELCQDIWEKSLLPVKKVLQHSGLSLERIYAVELIGGATRVPKLQAKLQEFLGRKELDRHLDVDEAIVLGAALHAANLSDGIKLNRKLGIVDDSLYGFVVEFNGPDHLKDENPRQLLVPRMKKVPSKMFRSVNHDKDFEVSLAYESEHHLPPGVTSPVIAQYQISGLIDAGEKYSSRNLSSPIKANIHFSLTRSGILSLHRADAVIEITDWVEVPRKNLTKENSTISSNVSTEAGASNSSQENSQNMQTDSGISKSSNISAAEKDAAEPATD
ncbi:unnamed protein product [Sphenostylis stenocarpa]|uniref:Heat shock 70 kDa protein 17 n=1 Tax=Sphenostylis stenocarpa TaxID=92480 RepID=A0AA86SUF6_9FABA|nr:unnamed protein product [Sphenostylis stenocarpa]